MASPVPSIGSTAVSKAEELIKNAHQALAIMNKGRLAYPEMNTYEFQSSSAASNEFETAPVLDYETAASAEDAVNPLSLHDFKRVKRSSQKFTYSISPELADAARVLAEAYPEPLSADYGVDISTVVSKYRQWANNDTNAPEQKYRKPNGLQDFIPVDESPSVPPRTEVANLKLAKRATTDFWLTSMTQRGKSPWAPEGYKVWRNVKDYGAKGDGVTDDTSAINFAISDGGRCGANCGSSTIYPAFVYFPPGTYLVSSSIIQYYNTEFYGNPFNYPTILAASSFVGLGVITSDVYTGENTQWYLNTNNFLRSIRNFRMDITRTDPNSYVCAIHWQVAQGTSLENIEFYMAQDGVTTQQGIYMENGSGGFLTNLTFIGGNFGAYFGNQQFTTNQLTFMNCKTALQMHWDWAWTMQDILINNCTNGIVIVGGAGGPGSTGQSVGSLIVLDSIIALCDVGIVTSLFSENSTSFLLQNTRFIAVDIAIQDNISGRTLMNGGSIVTVKSWGFGLVALASDSSTFYNGDDIPVFGTPTALVNSNKQFYQRRRPSYTNIGMSQVIDVKAWGAAGDGETDDGPILNSILDRAANMSAIVFFPFGSYVVKDTLHIPVGSRIIGQVWSQIMAKGPKFQKALEPRVAVRVGRPGDIGIIEIQSMMFTVSGPTAGAILMEWNVHESTQGSAAMWDSHFRVGGATGSLLRLIQCPKNNGTVKTSCKAASLLLHLTPKSSAYLENIWAWTADHDLDKMSQDQINIYSARGILIESQGPTWMYSTASEHNVIYQYQVSSAKNLYMSMIQTESPYYQPVPKAPMPFTTGLFPNDPVFTHCAAGSKTCAVSWALRVLDSTGVYIMGSGLYSWFSNYTQGCLQTENCQQRAVEISQSSNVWLFNLVTKAMVEMVTPVNEAPTLAANNVNGYMSSILAWVRGTNTTIGARDFPGFHLYRPENLDGMTETCKTALSQKILCDSFLASMNVAGVGRYIANRTLYDSVCDKGCGESLSSWLDNVSRNCGDQTIGRAKATKVGGHIYANYNLTCLKNPNTDSYCMEYLVIYPLVDSVDEMALTYMCSFCFVTLLTMRQSSIYAAFTEQDQRNLKYVLEKCNMPGPTDLHSESLLLPDPTPDPICASGNTYTTKAGDTCDTIAIEHSVASASIIFGNPTIIANCSALPIGKQLCLPFSCAIPYILQAADTDTCSSIEATQMVEDGAVRRYNPWLDAECTDLHVSRDILGRVVCLSPQAGEHNVTGDAATPHHGYNGYVSGVAYPPDDVTVATGTTQWCGRWHTVVEGDSCATLCLANNLSFNLFIAVNPSLPRTGCDASLVVGYAYCVGPHPQWEDSDEEWGYEDVPDEEVLDV